jgi:hypothetical protein
MNSTRNLSNLNLAGQIFWEILTRAFRRVHIKRCQRRELTVNSISRRAILVRPAMTAWIWRRRRDTANKRCRNPSGCRKQNKPPRFHNTSPSTVFILHDSRSRDSKNRNNAKSKTISLSLLNLLEQKEHMFDKWIAVVGVGAAGVWLRQCLAKN